MQKFFTFACKVVLLDQFNVAPKPGKHRMEIDSSVLPTVNFGELAAQKPPTLSVEAAALALEAAISLKADWFPDGEDHLVGVR